MNENIQSIASCSAAGIEVPGFPTFFPAEVHPDQAIALIERLRRMKQSCEACMKSKHDRVFTLVLCCLDEGINTMGTILTVLEAIGFNRKHVALIVREWTGSNPGRHRWWIDAEGRLTPHSEIM